MLLVVPEFIVSLLLEKENKIIFRLGSSHSVEDGLIKHISGCTNSSWFISVFKIKHSSKYLIFLIPRFVVNKCIRP